MATRLPRRLDDFDGDPSLTRPKRIGFYAIAIFALGFVIAFGLTLALWR